MSKQVLNRPMFAKMKDGTIKPVQYAFTGKAIKLALPYIGKGLQAAKNTLPAIITKGKNLVTGGGARATGGGTGTAVGPYLGGGPGLPAVIGQGGAALKGPGVKQILATGGSLLGYNTIADWMSESAEEEKDNPYGKPQKEKPKNSPSGIPKPKEEPDANKIDKEIKKGTLDDLIKERIGIFEKYLGDGKDTVRSGGFAALTEFGLNLASARGGNFMDKIARSAKDPLKTFTAIGMAAKDRADKIKMAGVEAGIKADEAQKERDADKTASSAFNQNLITLKAMFTGPDGTLTIDEEDLVNMAKSGQTTSKKEFFAENYKAYAGKLKENMEPYTDAEIKAILEQGWAIVSGQELPTQESGGGTTVTEDKVIKIE
jgi:hypothetical protein